MARWLSGRPGYALAGAALRLEPFAVAHRSVALAALGRPVEAELADWRNPEVLVERWRVLMAAGGGTVAH